MSETVQYVGTATKVDLKKTTPLEFMKSYLMTNKILPDEYESVAQQFIDATSIKYDQQYYYHPKSDTLYKLDYKSTEDYDDIMEATDNGKGGIDFILKYYNGGCGFDEALGEALNKLK